MIQPEKKEYRTSPFLLIIFVLFSTSIIIFSIIYYKNDKEKYQAEIENQLKAIADLKVRDIVQWQKERMGDGKLFYKNDVFTELVKRYFKDQKPNSYRMIRYLMTNNFPTANTVSCGNKLVTVFAK